MADMKPSASPRPPLIDGLARLNRQVSSWAASMSWGRLAVLILVVVAASSMVSEQLHLQHERIQVRHGGTPEDVDVTIFGPDGIHVTQKHGGPRSPASAAVPGSAPAQPGASAAAAPRAESAGADADPDAEPQRGPRTVSHKVWTVRGFIGDLGSALLISIIAYLIGAKIVVRKVKESDAKVRSAESAAEQEAMQRQLVQARLQVLQAQVEPHFLFNTLSAVDYLIETDPPRASQMQKALITYLRGALPQMRLEASTLGRELRLIRSYLQLIKMRIEDRLEVEFVVPVECEPAEFPPMMLQSLVENAIKHGIEPKPEGGRVTVSARVQDGELWVEVRDTGVGIVDPSRLEGAPTAGTGIGLANIRERLAMLYPGRSRLVVRSDDTGTRVSIVVPYRARPATAGRFGDGGSAA